MEATLADLKAQKTGGVRPSTTHPLSAEELRRVSAYWRACNYLAAEKPDWSDHSHSVALSAELSKEALLVHFIFNAYWQPLDFELPRLGRGKGTSWRRWIDTFQEVPEDIVPWQEGPTIPECTY
jgi:glycogen operon protein